MDDFMTRYNEYKEKWERIHKIREQISLCVSINMSVPELISKDGYYNLYEVRLVYSGKEFLVGVQSTLEHLNLSRIKDQIVQHILKWECKERGIEYPPRMER